MTQLCSVCPRGCGVDRAGGQLGFVQFRMHPWWRAQRRISVRPCISGTRGSGAVFSPAAACGAYFARTATSAAENTEKRSPVAQLAALFLRLRDEGVHNINLVTPSHYTPQIAEALTGLSLGIPGRVEQLGLRVRGVAAYARGARAGIPAGHEIRPVRTGSTLLRRRRLSAGRPRRHSGNVPADRTVPARRDGMLQRGVLIRHLILPQQGETPAASSTGSGRRLRPGRYSSVS